MPIYEFQCPKCKKDLEVNQKMSDPAPLCACEEGDPVEMIKQISLSSFSLKGQGWYRDGYSGKK